MGLLRRLFWPLTALVLLVVLPLRQRRRRRALQKSGWTELYLAGDVSELRPDRDVAQSFLRRLLKRKERPRIVLSRLRKFVDEMVSDRFAKGVLVRIGPISGGWASAAAIRTELQRLRDAGRHVVVHLEGAVDNRLAMIASVGTRLLMTPTASMGAAGTAVPGLFLRDTLDRFGVTMEVISRGKYKSAPDQFTRSDRSAPDAEQTKALVDQLDDALLAALMAGRVLNRQDAEALVDAAPMTGLAAKAAGFCDDVARDEDLGAAVQAVDGREDPPQPVGAARYLADRTLPTIWRRSKPSVGVVRVHGAILDATVPVPFSDPQVAVADTVVDDLRAALSDSKIGAVVLHVDSRGGSVTASDAIYAAVRRVDKEKPVIACFGDVAASGGYYVGCGARAIVASELTVTGSIGVFSLLPTWPKLTERYRVGHDSLQNRRNANLYDPWAGFDDERRAHAQKEVSAMYDAFVELVANARELSISDVDQVAQGRVWTGRDARQHRLLDDLGGFTAAVEQAKTEAGGSFSDDPVLVSARGPQTRPAPYDPDRPSTPRRWFGEALLDGSTARPAPSVTDPRLEWLSLMPGIDRTTIELLLLSLSSPKTQSPGWLYAPVNVPV